MLARERLGRTVRDPGRRVLAEMHLVIVALDYFAVPANPPIRARADAGAPPRSWARGCSRVPPHPKGRPSAPATHRAGGCRRMTETGSARWHGSGQSDRDTRAASDRTWHRPTNSPKRISSPLSDRMPRARHGRCHRFRRCWRGSRKRGIRRGEDRDDSCGSRRGRPARWRRIDSRRSPVSGVPVGRAPKAGQSLTTRVLGQERPAEHPQRGAVRPWAARESLTSNLASVNAK